MPSSRVVCLRHCKKRVMTCSLIVVQSEAHERVHKNHTSAALEILEPIICASKARMYLLKNPSHYNSHTVRDTFGKGNTSLNGLSGFPLRNNSRWPVELSHFRSAARTPRSEVLADDRIATPIDAVYFIRCSWPYLFTRNVEPVPRPSIPVPVLATGCSGLGRVLQLPEETIPVVFDCLVHISYAPLLKGFARSFWCHRCGKLPS